MNGPNNSVTSDEDESLRNLTWKLYMI